MTTIQGCKGRGQADSRPAFTRADFQACLFYAAASSDLQPLLRFSNLTSTFLYVCVSDEINEDILIQSVEDKVARLQEAYPGALRLLGVRRGLQIGDFDYQWPVDWHTLMSAREAIDYRQMFGRFQRDDNWALEFTFLRQVGMTRRHLRLVYINGEALATYAALSHQGTLAPRILCTIQTGVLEQAQGITARFLARSPAHPALWVRGVWRTPGDRPFELDDFAGQVICHRGPYPVRVQTHERWNSRMNSSILPRNRGGENPWSEESLVKSYAARPPELPGVVSLDGGDRPVRVLNRRLRADDAENYDRLFAPSRLANRCGPLPLHPLDANRHPVPSGGLPLGPRQTLADALAQVDDYAAEHRGAAVALIACGFEDEGVCLREWATAAGPACQLDVFAPEPLDYADLRGWSSN